MEGDRDAEKRSDERTETGGNDKDEVGKEEKTDNDHWHRSE